MQDLRKLAVNMYVAMFIKKLRSLISMCSTSNEGLCGKAVLDVCSQVNGCGQDAYDQEYVYCMHVVSKCNVQVVRRVKSNLKIWSIPVEHFFVFFSKVYFTWQDVLLDTCYVC